MDLGAHFHCCDLQVHSPRDRNWKGDCPITDDERRAYSEEFVKACRTKGLRAVGITDHHDLAFYPYIRRAAVSEVDTVGNPLHEEDRLVVFPGLELTLALPCQALLIFDPETNEENLTAAMAALGIQPAPSVEAKGNTVQKLRFVDLQGVCDALNSLPSIIDHYILLPNVNDGGADTILRQDFCEHYKAMPCVGGYVDHDCSGHGKKLILNGFDSAWGNKCIGVIQTSDSRSSDFSKLGISPTWIKLSLPTSEAVRQACLSPRSRIRYATPLVPDSWISRIEVSGSKYFGSFAVEFNPQFNAIIGGRGSGKSTVLEYLRWALCDQPYVHSGDEGSELPNYERRRRSLVSTTLEPTHGTVTVDYFRHGVLHKIRREAGTNKVFLKIGDNNEQETTDEVIQTLAQIQGYSQKQLSHVSVRTQELERLLTAPIAQDLSNVEAELKAQGSVLRQAFERSESKRALREQLQALELDLDSKKQQLVVLSEQVKDLPEDQRKAIDAHPAFSEGNRQTDSLQEAILGTSSTVLTAENEVRKILAGLPQTGVALPNAELTEIREKLAAGIQGIADQLHALSENIEAMAAGAQQTFEKIAVLLSEHRNAYDAAASENEVVQERLGSLRALSEQISGLEIDRVTLTRRTEEIGDADSSLTEARAKWLSIITRKRQLLEKQAIALLTDSDKQLRVRIGPPQNIDDLRMAVQNALAGAQITRTEKLDALLKSVATNADPVGSWLECGHELIALSRVGARLDSGAGLPSTVRLKQSGLIDAELGRIARRLKPQAAFELTLLYPDSAPIFEFRVTQTDYEPFEDASPGQQATALIGLLLNQSAGSLVVDQPEDDLDNLTIMQVAERLWSAKEKRQIIFSTHNPNLVVIGDAELVLHCAYALPGQAARLRIADQGAIDNPKVCEVVARVMEGGEQAFSLRRQKYGF